ncbi:uncharacterized protein LOC110988158 [Acanthaster planci]|uniref:Uncharacterized protein LOC110988158 n=1 Tax=Acanthaster planci TaxID=133434 RepID=A0A8B7ZUE1_ACAPL|nr:uncharacterized protein LOC110988158 [Acanthaster planci]
MSMMRIVRSEVAFLVVGVILSECATLAIGTTCEEIPVDICSALPYTQTGFPSSLGHASRDQIPPNLGSAFQTLIAIGCYENVQLFLCAAAFPQCSTSGPLLRPCRALCEGAMLGCGFWFGFYSDLLDGINCEAMVNSSDPNICVGLNTTPQLHVTSQQVPKGNTAIFETTLQMKTTNSTGLANTHNSVSTSETLFATLLPRQPATTLSRENEDDENEADVHRKPVNSTFFYLASSDFTSEVTGQRSTASKGGHKMTDSVDKAVKTDTNIQGGFKSPSIHVVPALGVLLSALSCAGMVVLLVSCAFFRKAFGKPFGVRRRKPRDGAFYTNPAFSDLPQASEVRSENGQSLQSKQQPYTLDDLPPHPASANAMLHPHKQVDPNIYQLEPNGFVEQNLFAVPHSPLHNHPDTTDPLKASAASSKVETKVSSDMEDSGRVTSDLVYSNKVPSVAMDSNENKHGPNTSRREGNNGSAAAPSSGDSFPVTSTSCNMDNGEMVIANPIAC